MKGTTPELASLLCNKSFKNKRDEHKKIDIYFDRNTVYLKEMTFFVNLKVVVLEIYCGRGSRVVKVSDRSWPCHEFEPSTTKSRRAGQRCTLNLSRAETSVRWCGVVIRRGGASSGVVHVT
ncbi:hypothetical protein TNCV_1605301 [Trichonephila clavipes]|nr:hypothetical protein TNCV_1605301 [Trichonephila clavipes]